jgi:ribose 5-phosphate isomerase
MFDEPANYHKLEDELMELPGVVATGLLLGVASAAILATPKGEPQLS